MPRFERVHTDYHGRLGLPVGVFVAVDHLRRAGRLAPDDEALWLAIDDWFVAHLPEPPQYADGNSLGAITWFKTPVPALMQRRVDVATRLLSKYGVAWSVSASDAPGEVVYEDEYQVAVVPPVRGEPSAPPAGLVLGPTTSGSKQALASEESAVARRHLAYYATELGDRATRTLHANRSRQLAGFISSVDRLASARYSKWAAAAAVTGSCFKTPDWITAEWISGPRRSTSVPIGVCR